MAAPLVLKLTTRSPSVPPVRAKVYTRFASPSSSTEDGETVTLTALWMMSLPSIASPSPFVGNGSSVNAAVVLL